MRAENPERQRTFSPKESLDAMDRRAVGAGGWGSPHTQPQVQSISDREN